MALCRASGVREAEVIEMTGYLVDPDSTAAPPELPPAPTGPTLCRPCFVARFPAWFQPYVTGERPLSPEQQAIIARMEESMAREQRDESIGEPGADG